MGTSGSFGGSGGKNASDLRDNIAEWLDGVDDLPESPEGSDDKNDPSDQTKYPQVDLEPALRLLLSSRRQSASGDGAGGGASVGTGADGSGGRSSGGAVRSLGRVSRAAGRAGQLALAYSSGDREALREAGLDYDDLRALNDPLAVGLKIVELAFESQATSTIEDDEERSIVAALVEWILVESVNQALSPEDVVRKSIEVVIAETALTEVAASMYAKQASRGKRQRLEQEIRKVAAVYAAQANLSPSGATTREMAQAIENGIRDIGVIYGVES